MRSVDYDRQASAYSKARGLPQSALTEWRNALAPHLPGPLGAPILDVGSGAGHFATALAHWFDADVIGVEPSRAMLEQAREQNAHTRVRYVEGSAEHLPLPDSSCSAGWLSTVVHQIRDLGACGRELSRVLRDGAPVLVRGAFPGHLGDITLFRFFPAARAVAERFPSIDDVVAAFAPAAFVLESVGDVAQVSAPNLSTFCDRLEVARSADSTLATLGDEEFATGLRAARRAAEADTEGLPVVDRLTLVVMRHARARVAERGSA